MTDKKHEEEYKPYKPEHPADAKTLKKEREEIREAAKHAQEDTSSKETDDEEPVSREQAEKELRDAVRKVKQEKKK